MFCCTTERYFISSFIQLLSYGQYVSRTTYGVRAFIYIKSNIIYNRNEAFLIVEIESENEKMENKRDEM